MASRPGLESRVAAVLDLNRRRFALSRRASMVLTILAAGLLGVAGMLSPLAPSRLRAASETGAPTAATSAGLAARGIPMLHVAGRVEDERGTAATDATIEIGSAFDQHTAHADADGQFAMSVPAKEIAYHTLVARTRDGARQASIHYMEGAPTPAEVANLKLILRPAREFPVTVTDDKGAPVEGARVLGDSWYSPVGQVRTDSAGRATLRLPADAELTHILVIKPSAGLDYVLFRPKDRPKTDPYQLEPDFSGPIHFVLNGMRTVVVKVTEEGGKPLGGVKVYPWMFERPKKGADVNLSGDPGFVQVTDAAGLARMPVPTDDVQRAGVVFWTQLDGYSAPKRCIWDPKSGKNEVSATLVRQVPITGTAVGPDGGPLAGATVRVEGDGFRDDHFRGEVQTGIDGTFHIDVDGDMYYMFVASKGRLTSAPHMQLIRNGTSPGPIRLEMKPGTRVYGHVLAEAGNVPVARAALTLIYQDDQSYLKLPPEEQLPGGVIGRKAIMANVVEFSHADAGGAFEYFLPPGTYRLDYWNGSTNTRKEFRVADEKALPLDVRVAPPEPLAVLKGRVVMADRPEATVAEAKISGRGADPSSTFSEAVADARGSFTIRRGKGEMYVCAASPDDRLRGIVRIGAGEDHVTVPVGPTASARGRLTSAGGDPQAGTTLQYGVQISFPDGGNTWVFGGEVKTAGDGTFVLKGLVPGFEYVVYAVVEYVDDRPNRFSLIGKATPASMEALDLGSLKLAPSQMHRRDTADRMTEAFGKAQPLAERLRAAQHVARASHQNVLVVVGARDRAACQQIYEYREDFARPAVADALVNYVLVTADIDSSGTDVRAWADAMKIAWPASGGATFAVLDPQGRLLAQTSSDALSAGPQLDRGRLIGFARAHAPAMPDARRLLDDALVQARREGKHVLFDESGPYCPWCVKLTDYLEANRPLIEKDFVWVTIDRRFAHGPAVIEQFHKENAGTPWMGILDADGHVVVTSDGPKGNIGYPGEAGGQQQWDKMLRAGARRLTESDIRQLMAGLETPAPAGAR